MTVLIVVLAVVSVILLFRWRLRQPLMPESLYRVDFDESTITGTFPQGDRQVVEWSKLTRVAIRTTDEGPWEMDVFWGFNENGSSAATAVFPGGATGEQPLITELDRRLPGCKQIIMAMSSASNAYFILWDSASSAAQRSLLEAKSGAL